MIRLKTHHHHVCGREQKLEWRSNLPARPYADAQSVLRQLGSTLHVSTLNGLPDEAGTTLYTSHFPSK